VLLLTKESKVPNCFTLTKKGEDKPSNLNQVDEAICKHFNADVSPIYYYKYWYTSIGLALAIGHDWEWMRGNFDKELIEIVDFLAENYTPCSWWEPKG
jgi:hypothetical protein